MLPIVRHIAPRVPCVRTALCVACRPMSTRSSSDGSPGDDVPYQAPRHGGAASSAAAPWKSAPGHQGQTDRDAVGAQQSASSAEEVFARVLKKSRSHVAAAHARTHALKYQQQLQQCHSQPLPLTHDVFGRENTSQHAPLSSVQKMFARQQPSSRSQKRAGTGRSDVNSAAWCGLRRVFSKTAPYSSSLATTTSHAGTDEATTHDRWHAPPSPPPVPHPPSAQAIRDAAHYNRVYAQWQADNTLIINTLRDAPRVRDAARRAIHTSRQRSFQEYEQKTIRWTMWYVLPIMLIAHIAFFTDATLFAMMMEDVAYVDYGARMTASPDAQQIKVK